MVRSPALRHLRDVHKLNTVLQPRQLESAYNFGFNLPSPNWRPQVRKTSHSPTLKARGTMQAHAPLEMLEMPEIWKKLLVGVRDRIDQHALAVFICRI